MSTHYKWALGDYAGVGDAGPCAGRGCEGVRCVHVRSSKGCGFVGGGGALAAGGADLESVPVGSHDEAPILHTTSTKKADDDENETKEDHEDEQQNDDKSWTLIDHQ